MILSGFAESNKILNPPDEMTPDQCEPAQVWTGPIRGGDIVTITCWKITRDELREIQRTGRVWLLCWGQSMPPAAVQGFSPFLEGAE